MLPHATVYKCDLCPYILSSEQVLALENTMEAEMATWECSNVSYKLNLFYIGFTKLHSYKIYIDRGYGGIFGEMEENIS